MTIASRITLFLSLCILGSSLSSCEAAFLLEYPLEKILDCVLFDECPQPRNVEPKPHIIYRPPAEQAVSDYYSNINSSNYQTSWRSLSSHFQENSTGYSSYKHWWDKQVKRVDVLNTYRISANSYYSTVDVRLRYLMSSNREIEQILRFNLIWDKHTSCWLINSIERL
ncbi:hypothetical protein [Okeania sp. SIO2B3]|uniref:hypothetical protein n=1 Tax=Okeania sp. SIO2B3 TaxID=2607784 RepID=UPI0013BF1B76|nr:hypothetical protein [Okeania sp. SIO2B3]NET41694.1 hypothetical protein [Okeania sp. SIO2B3]